MYYYHSIPSKQNYTNFSIVPFLFVYYYAIKKELFKMTVVRSSLLISVHMSFKEKEDFNKSKEKDLLKLYFDLHTCSIRSSLLASNEEGCLLIRHNECR